MGKIVDRYVMKIRRGQFFRKKFVYKNADGTPFQNLSSYNPAFIIVPPTGSDITCDVANGKLTVTDLTATMEIILSATDTGAFAWTEGRCYFVLRPSGQTPQPRRSFVVQVVNLYE